MFTKANKETSALEKTKKIIDFYKENGNFPSGYKNKPKDERSMASYLGGVRLGKSILYESCQKLAEDAGLPDMFVNQRKTS